MQAIFCFDICAAIIICMLFVAQIIRKMTKGRTNMLFLLVAFSVLMSSVLNMLDGMYGSFIEINAYNLYVRYHISLFYFIFRNISPLLYVLYLCSYLGVWSRLKSSKYIIIGCFIPYVIDFVMLVTNQVTHKMFYYDENMGYRRGPFLSVLYVVAVIYIIIAMYIIVKNRRLVTTYKMIVLMTFLPLNALTVVVQLLKPGYRIDNFATTVAMLALVMEVQRPEETIDSVVGVDNYSSFITQVDKVYKTLDPKSLLLIKFVNYHELSSSMGHDNFTGMLKIFGDKIYQINKVMKCYCQSYYMDLGAFAVMTDRDRYEQLLDMGRILAAYMQENFRMGQLEVMLDARICLVNIPEDIQDYESLINFCTTFHNKLPKDRRVQSLSTVADTKGFRMRNDMDAIIKRGILNYNFQMYYQPIYSIEKKRFVSAEALIRLEDEQYGFVSPALFIPEAEESGAIHQIGDFVLEDVCRFIGSNDFKSLGLEYIEINLSVAQCIESNLYEKIDALMEKYGVSPEQINLEITETGVNYDPVTTDRNISLLNKKGIAFSLDDYGTGYSSIKRVVTLPLDIVKLDKSLVDDMDSPIMWTVITNTVRMLKRMNKKILVEGVENKRALDKFTELGCDYIQGYYFSKPLNESSFLKFVISKNFGVDI